jgi:hypothetical protein
MLNGNNTASVELTYMPGYKSGDFTYKEVINYFDPLGLQSSAISSSYKKGAFMYDNIGWNLISIG